MLQTMIADFQQHFWLYVSIPFMSGLIGYVTKVIAIQMMFSPLEFKGIKPFLAGKVLCLVKPKMATTAVELMTAKLIKPEEILLALIQSVLLKKLKTINGSSRRYYP